MTSRNLSSEARFPCIMRRGGSRLTSSLNRALMSALVALSSRLSWRRHFFSRALERPLALCFGLGGALGEQPERIVGGEAVGEAAGPGAIGCTAIASPGIDAERPGRPMPDRVVLLMLDHFLVGQSGEVIIGFVVFPHMIEAEAVILALLTRVPLARGKVPALCSPATRKTERNRAAGGSGPA